MSLNHVKPSPSRVAQTVASLREALSGESWSTCLPGERILSQHLGVSRPTLRAALGVLEKERWIATQPGRRRVILPRKSASPRPRGFKAVIITRDTEYELPRTSLLYLDALRNRLRAAGIAFELHSHPMFGRNAPHLIRDLLPKPDSAQCFILFSPSATMQQYCDEQGYPAVIAGTSVDGISLPSLDTDYRGIARHAVGTFLARGHRRIALFTSSTGLAGDLLTQEGFLEAVQAAEDRQVSAEVVLHRDDSEDIRSRFRALFRSPEKRPTALLVSRAHHAITVLCALAARGLRVPHDVSLLCRDADPVLEWALPSVGHYRTSPQAFASRLARAVQEVVRSGYLPARHQVIVPDFIAGASISAPPENAP